MTEYKDLKMKYTEKDLYEGMELLCIDNGGWSLWETGEIYTVTKSNLSGKLIIEGDDEVGRTFRDTEAILGYLNGERGTRLSTIEDQKEEETMQEFKLGDLVEITSNTSNARNEKDELYNVGEKAIITDVYSTTVRIGNHKWANLITKDELKKVEPTATITVDVEQRLNDKIESLRSERENILSKIERMEGQRVKLRDKIQKLNEAKEALEILKEFK
ncbi:hypothetical protein [Enterococcus phage vB_Efs19_KEN07]